MELLTPCNGVVNEGASLRSKGDGCICHENIQVLMLQVNRNILVPCCGNLRIFTSSCLSLILFSLKFAIAELLASQLFLLCNIQVQQ